VIRKFLNVSQDANLFHLRKRIGKLPGIEIWILKVAHLVSVDVHKKKTMSRHKPATYSTYFLFDEEQD